MARAAAETDPGGVVYAGEVMHLRLRPKRHLFRYRVACLLLDLDGMAQTMGRLRFAALDRRAPVSVRLADHGPRDGSALRPWVEARLAEAGVTDADGRPLVPARIRMLAFPRVFGYAFNPLTVYFCDASDGRLAGVVYEVKNTFGDQHPYALAAGPIEGGLHRQTQTKEFFVSPFIDMAKSYRFALRPPGERLALRIEETDAAGPYLLATWNGRAEPLTDATLARRFLWRPLTTRKVWAGIHYEAARLALKGVRFLGHPGKGKVVRRASEGGR